MYVVFMCVCVFVCCVKLMCVCVVLIYVWVCVLSMYVSVLIYAFCVRIRVCVVFVFWGGCITFEWDYSYLLQRDLVVSVEIHGGKQRVWAVSQPHKHVPVWHTLAQAQQLQLKEQYRTFRDTRGWGETVELVK